MTWWGSRVVSHGWNTRSQPSIMDRGLPWRTFIGLQRCPPRITTKRVLLNFISHQLHLKSTIICCVSALYKPSTMAHSVFPSMQDAVTVGRWIGPYTRLLGLLRGCPAKWICGLPAQPGWRRPLHQKPVFWRWNPCWRAGQSIQAGLVFVSPQRESSWSAEMM